MPAYPQSNAVGLTREASILLEAEAIKTGATKQEIASRIIHQRLTAS